MTDDKDAYVSAFCAVFAVAILLGIIFFSGCAHSQARRNLRVCTDDANDMFRDGQITYAERTDIVRACLAEYNR